MGNQSSRAEEDLIQKLETRNMSRREAKTFLRNMQKYGFTKEDVDVYLNFPVKNYADVAIRQHLLELNNLDAQGLKTPTGSLFTEKDVKELRLHAVKLLLRTDTFKDPLWRAVASNNVRQVELYIMEMTSEMDYDTFSEIYEIATICGATEVYKFLTNNQPSGWAQEHIETRWMALWYVVCPRLTMWREILRTLFPERPSSQIGLSVPAIFSVCNEDQASDLLHAMLDLKLDLTEDVIVQTAQVAESRGRPFPGLLRAAVIRSKRN